jgi:uncharacterized protein YdaU (DUF1376 family)
MSHEQSPAFQFYVGDFLSDGNVGAMSLEECGAYIRLLCFCWREGSLPSHHKRLARLVGVPPGKFRRLWPAIVECFREQDGRLIHPRLEKERQKQADYRRRQSQAGKASAAARQPEGNRRSTAVQPGPQPEPNSSSSVFDLPSSVSDLGSSLSDIGLQASTHPDQSQQSGVHTIRRARKTALDGDGHFARFWASYPNKKGKDDARKAWQKREPSDALTDRIVAAVEKQKAWPDWTKDGGRFIPHPATWLNRGSWDDEPTERGTTLVSDLTRQNDAHRREALRLIEENSNGPRR